MVKSKFRIGFATVAVVMMGITSTQAEAPVSGYGGRSYGSRGGYPSSSSGYLYEPPRTVGSPQIPGLDFFDFTDVPPTSYRGADAPGSEYGRRSDDYGEDYPSSSPGYFDGPRKEVGIPGTPGVDYPVFTKIPRTSFSCERQPLPGYYADPEAACQVYHVCQKGVKEREPMLCPVGSIFDQEKLTCAWWYTVDCARSAAAAPAVNADVVAAMERADALAKANRYAGYGHGGPSGAYGAPSQAYGVPSGVFGAPPTAYNAPSTGYNAPSTGYNAPSTGYNAPSTGYNAPSTGYNAPSTGYNAPSVAYGAPTGPIAFGSYNSQLGPLNALMKAYGAPSRRIGGSFRGFEGSLKPFGSDFKVDGALSPVSSDFGGDAPSGTYGAPSIGSSGAPLGEYVAPGDQGGSSYLPPSY